MNSNNLTGAAAELHSRFVFHPATEDQAVRSAAIRAAAEVFAQAVLVNSACGRERSISLTKIDEAMMWANASIARNE